MSTKVYYGPYYTNDDNYRIVPAPVISINSQPNYANENIVGYTYSITLNGYATGQRKNFTETIVGGNGTILQPESSGSISTEENIPIVTENASISYTVTNESNDNIKYIRKVLENVNFIRKILSRNGKCLTIRDEQNNPIIVAKGGTLKSLSFDNNENGWSAYAQYTAEIEFNEVEFLGESIFCGGSSFDGKNFNIVDVNNIKIREFNDSWSFNIDDSSFNIITDNEISNALNINNSTINLSYSLSAVGKNFYKDNEQLVPAWEQAKEFCQQRLYDQVKNLLDKILSLNSDIACNANKTLGQIHSYQNGILSDINNSYSIYNETVTCECSESEGSFSVNYNSMIKKNQSGSYESSNTKHTVSKVKNITKNSQANKNISISIQGNIEGLLSGGLINSPNNFTLPKTGSFLIGSSNNSSKINSALSLLPNIIDEDDLATNFKNALGITLTELGVDPNSDCNNLKPASFNLTKNYMEGTISYSVEYNTETSSQQETEPSTLITNIAANVTNPAPILAEFTIPAQGIIIQDINTRSARKISYSIQGKSPKNCCNQQTLSSIIQNSCNEEIPINIPLPSEDSESFMLLSKKYDKNIIEGSFSLNLEYQCSSRCRIT